MIQALHHIAIDVDDLPAAIAFYGDAIGLPVADRPEVLGANGIWFELGNAQFHLVEAPDFEAPKTNQHLALHVADTLAEVARLRAEGLDVSDPFDVGAGLQAFLRDPAGNLVELNQPAT